MLINYLRKTVILKWQSFLFKLWLSRRIKISYKEVEKEKGHWVIKQQRKCGVDKSKVRHRKNIILNLHVQHVTASGVITIRIGILSL